MGPYPPDEMGGWRTPLARSGGFGGLARSAGKVIDQADVGKGLLPYPFFNYKNPGKALPFISF